MNFHHVHSVKEKQSIFPQLVSRQNPLTKTQAGYELGSTVRHGAVWVERFQ